MKALGALRMSLGSTTRLFPGVRAGSGGKTASWGTARRSYWVAARAGPAWPVPRGPALPWARSSAPWTPPFPSHRLDAWRCYAAAQLQEVATSAEAPAGEVPHAGPFTAHQCHRSPLAPRPAPCIMALPCPSCTPSCSALPALACGRRLPGSLPSLPRP